MKYYSKDPREFKDDLDRLARNEGARRKKNYLLQIANLTALAVAVIIMLKSPGMKKDKESIADVKDSEIRKTIAWKGWGLETRCSPPERCTLFLTRQGKDTSASSFSWNVIDQNTGEPVVQAFELIPKDMAVNETRSFHLEFPDDSRPDAAKKTRKDVVSLRFLDNRNEELLSIQIYP